MSLDVFNAYVDGYADRLFDQQVLAMQTGHWAAYFVGSKHPKPVKELAEKMYKNKQGAKRSKSGVAKPEVDVDAYLEREANFRARLEQQGR